MPAAIVNFESLSRPTGVYQESSSLVPYKALSPWMSRFSRPGVKDFSQLTLDLTRNQLIVGARNHLFRLSLSNASLLQAVEWGPDEDTKRSVVRAKERQRVSMRFSTGSRRDYLLV
ncbi:semaphorin-5B-like [Salvelinus sp. IW2-2015]|uniref:semaphorin-5B-like n=1 Tax=Salvelinus sp. IW2-2015 TaxID=2691554 RepID=UPI000CEA94A1|nr:semaphorin-5B-like [Salvelinus alpinus]